MSKFQSISLPTLSDSATMKEVENESRKMGLDILNKINTVDSGVVHTTGNETIAGTKTFTSSIVGNLTGNFLNTSGSNVASASTISTTGSVFHVTGTTAINTINIPYTGFTGSITIIPDAEFTFGTSGNIGGGQTYCAIANKPIVLTYDGTKWWPVASQDSGSNANGYYIRYSDGTMQCWGNVTQTNAITGIYGVGLFFYNNTSWQTFPIAFTVIPSTNITTDSSVWCTPRGTSATTIGISALAGTSETSSHTYYWFAIGKWK